MKTFLYLTIFISILRVLGCDSSSDLKNQVEIDLRKVPISKLDFDTPNRVFLNHDFVLGVYQDQFLVRATVEDRYGLYLLDPAAYFNQN